ncbi:MAG: zf-HC2 domain-containing protein [Candidatus Aminicenantia bacterium]
MKHKKVIKKLPLFYLGGLDNKLNKKIEKHLEECPRCREGLNSLRVIFKGMEKHSVLSINSFAFERIKNLAKEKLQRREIEYEERIKTRLIVLTSFFSLFISILIPILIFKMVSSIVPWAIFRNFTYFFALWWGIFSFFSLVTIPIILKIKQIYFKEVNHGII